jgi:putative nucleotidyltransferase with HDIG domain
MEHPFLFGSFKIRTAKQLETLKRLGLKEIAYDPSKSDVEPEPLRAECGDTPPVVEGDSEFFEQMWKEKCKQIQLLRERRQRLHRVGCQYQKSIDSVKDIMRDLLARSDHAIQTAAEFIGGIVNSFVAAEDVAIHQVNVKTEGQGFHQHVINVTVLSMMLGKRLELTREDLFKLGLGALFHDIGKCRIPSRVLRKSSPLTRAEHQLYAQHPLYGLEQARGMKTLPREVIEVIAQHHEAVDGSGYPKKLKGTDIATVAKIVAITDTYDNHCSPHFGKEAMTPYESVSQMYANERNRFDEAMLSLFISSLGVYPPGTVVRLSDDNIGMVVSINPDNLLRPNLVLYDAEIPCDKSVIVDLREEEDSLTITKSIRSSSLPTEVLEYLNPGMSMNYYFDSHPGRL